MSPRSRTEVEQTLANTERRLDALRARAAKLAKSDSPYDQLELHEVQVLLAYHTRSRLEMERERVLLDVEDLRRELEVADARAAFEGKPAPAKARTAQIERLEAEARSLAG